MKKTLSLGLVVLLAACASGSDVDEMKLDYSRMGKIQLNTQDLRIVDRTKNTPQWSPYVGHLFTPSLTDAVYRLAGDRLQAVGQMGHATFVIKEASVTEQPLNVASDFESIFTRQQATKYIGRIEVSLEAQSPRDAAIAVANAHAVHSITLPEDPSEEERYTAYKKLVNSLISNLNAQLEPTISKYMVRFMAAPTAPVMEGTPTNDSALPSSTMNAQ